jgi:hypothetical protein
MTNQTEKIESIQAELTELEKMYHTITDMAAEYFNPHVIQNALQIQIIMIDSSLTLAKEQQKQYEAERALEDATEFDKYSKD